MKYKTISDMGSVKIFSNNMSAFFKNNIGDGVNTVQVLTDEKKKVPKNYEFLGHFTVKKKGTVHLSSYDCKDKPIYTFGVGRWFVYLNRSANFFIEYVDDEVRG